MTLTETDYEILARQINMSVSVFGPLVARSKPVEILSQPTALDLTRDVQSLQDLSRQILAQS